MKTGFQVQQRAVSLPTNAEDMADVLSYRPFCSAYRSSSRQCSMCCPIRFASWYARSRYLPL